MIHPSRALIIVSALAGGLFIAGCNLPETTTDGTGTKTPATPASPATPAKPAPPATETTPRSPTDGVGSGFLWKPVSESNGKLAVLFPSNYTGKIARASLHSGFPVTDANRLEDGIFSTTGNGNRMTWRFSKSGGGYPAPTYSTAHLKDGSSVTYMVSSPGSRVD